MGIILLEGLEFYAFHGALPEEQVIGAKYVVDVNVEVDFTIAASTDNLEGTIDYSEIYKVIECEMSKSSKLIEHVADRIVKMLFVTFKTIEQIEVKVTKLKPPIDGDVPKVSVVLKKSREEL